MICRKITYSGNLDEAAATQIFDITRKNEINAVVKKLSSSEVELLLEGDPSYIKLIQHQIERSLKNKIQNKVVETVPYQYLSGINLKL